MAETDLERECTAETRREFEHTPLSATNHSNNNLQIFVIISIIRLLLLLFLEPRRTCFRGV